MAVNEEEKEIEEAGMTTVGPIVANGDSTESDLASTIQPEFQDDDERYCSKNRNSVETVSTVDTN